jgi:RNA polymerase sigma factor (TIGR02999 family)
MKRRHAMANDSRSLMSPGGNSMTAPEQVVDVLAAVERSGEPLAERLLPLVYEELRRLAAHQLAHEKPGQTLGATDLVHEAYLRLVNSERTGYWTGRGHFFAAAAQAMRRILIERARRKATLKHGGERVRVDLDQLQPIDECRNAELLALDEALTALEQHDPLAAQLVNLRYFAGLGHQEAAEMLGISRRAADRLWKLARAWLFRQLDTN